ncbi:MAG TPA: phosphoribosylformylglycinamidine cyclo-ligase [Phycisphaerae bacterium]
MSAAKKFTYAGAGVDIDANAVWVSRIKSAMARTYGPRVIGRHGLFAGLFRLDYEEALLRKNYRKPVLIGCTDGVGTKVLLAIQAKRLNTIGIDLVAMNVNDLITCGGEPLFFLDYLAVHKLDTDALLVVLEGIAAGCREAGCALLGGETAEMPDLYRQGDLDLAGFAVGVVESRRVIDARRVAPQDVLIGLPSSGVHSNGYSLVRKIIRREKYRLEQHIESLGETLADALLRPTRIYVKAVRHVLSRYRRKRVVTAMAHITGGGLPENVGRVLPPECDAVIETSAWTPPPIFAFLRSCGVERDEMFRVFNMGIGYVFVVRPDFAGGVMGHLRRAGERPVIIGRIRRGSGRVLLK